MRITTPAEGATVSGSEVTITLDVGTLHLVSGTQATKPDDLHVHYLLDVDPTPWLDGKLAIPTGDPSIVHSATTSYTFKDLKPGPHKVTVILTTANHLAVQPPVASSVSFSDVVELVWKPRGPIPTARYYLGVTAGQNGRIYAIGGFDGIKALATVEEFDPATGAWSPRASMPTARYDFGVAAAGNGRIYAIGGFDGSRRLATVEEYDPDTDTWATKVNMPTARSRLAASAARNGRIYAIGGCKGNVCEPLTVVEEYDPTSNSWISKASMHTARGALGAVEAINGKVYAFGGCDGAACQASVATVEEYDLATNTWATKVSIPTARYSFGVVAASNGKIYVGGGFDGRAHLATLEEYDPTTNTWASGTSLPVARNGLGMAATKNGSIYAVGGDGGGAGPVVEGTILSGRPQVPSATSTTPNKSTSPSPPSPSTTTSGPTPAPLQPTIEIPPTPPGATTPAATVTPTQTDGNTGLPIQPLVIVLVALVIVGGGTISGIALLRRPSQPTKPNVDSVPRQLARRGFEVIGEPKRGGMSEVYRARQPALDRYVAVKIIRPDLISDPAIGRRIEAEARQTAKLEHPNIVQIYDIGQLSNGPPFVVMRYIEGKTLREMLAEKSWLTIERAINVATAVAEALDYAHQRGIVHCDVKPSNIMIEPGDHVTLTDFGIAQAVGESSVNAPRVVVGTPRYLSPEQASGHPADHRSDIYSLGVVLYEMLTGRAPFEADTTPGMLYAHTSLPPRPPRELNQDIPQALEVVVLRALRKDPSQRYQSAHEFIDDLQTWPTIRP